MVRRTIAFIILFSMLFIAAAGAAEMLGVKVYPGAKLDPDRTKIMNISVEGAAYRTDDAIGKVTAFYRNEGLLFLRAGEPSKEHARFKKSDVDVVIQNPWKNEQTGAVMHDTLIMIIRERD